MGLKIAGGFALTVANTDDRLHGQRIDRHHDKSHQPIQQEHCADQDKHCQNVTNKVICQPDKGLAHQIEIIHDPRHESAGWLARYHRQVSLDQALCHVLLQVRRYPQRQRIDLNRLHEQGNTFDEGKNDDCRRCQPNNFCRSAICKSIENISRQ